MWSGKQLLLLLVGLAAVLAAGSLIVHGLSGPDTSAPADGDEALASDGPEGTEGKGAGDDGGKGGPQDPVSVETYRDVVKLSWRRDPKYLPELKQAAGDSEWKKRHAAVSGIGQLKEKGDPEFLLSVLSNEAERPEVRAAAAEGLGAMRFYEAGPALIQAMENGPLALRTAAGVALRRIMKVHYGYRAGDSIERRREALNLIRSDWPQFHAYMKGRQG
ncbi:MAG: HEAT repeat domain-containing protein [Phycisphaerae bacterium]